MAQLIHEFPGLLVDAEGRDWLVRVKGESNGDGCWAGWLEFLPLHGGPRVATNVETLQSDRMALTHWALGLEREDWASALERATTEERTRLSHPVSLR